MSKLLSVLGKARSDWHDVEQKSRRGSDRWFRARLARAQIELRLGDAAAAAKIIRLTQALYPTLGGEKLKMIGDAPGVMYMLDKEMSARVFTPPAEGE